MFNKTTVFLNGRPIPSTPAQQPDCQANKLVFNIFASLAEFERELVRERTQAGLSAARARGRLGGRPKGLSPKAESTSRAAAALYREGELSVQAIADHLGIAKTTLYSYLRHRGVEISAYHSTNRSRRTEDAPA